MERLQGWIVFGVALALFCLIVGLISALGGCGPVQVGPKDSPAVQVGPDEGPAIAADLTAQAGLVAVETDHGDVATSQPASQTVGDQSAGGDARQVTVNLTASGSGWAAVATIVGLAAVVAAVVLVYVYARARAEAGEARLGELNAASVATRTADRHAKLTGNAVAVAKAIRDLGPGAQRDRLLRLIQDELPDRADWDRLLAARALAVQRTRTTKERPEQ